jgi:hypothetical protein
MAALSHTLPERLIERSTPLSTIKRGNGSLVYWVPQSGWCNGASGHPRRNRHEQCVGDKLRIVSAVIGQPTTRRKNRSIAAAT